METEGMSGFLSILGSARMCGVAAVVLLGVLAGCAGTGGERATAAPDAGDAAPASAKAAPKLPVKAGAAPASPGSGRIELDVTNVLGASLPCRVTLLPLSAEGRRLDFESAGGSIEETAPAGEYRAYVHVVEAGVPILVEVRDVRVEKDAAAMIPVNILEGTSGMLLLRDFDFDGDLALDRVELASGTDPQNAADVPGQSPLALPDSVVLSSEADWYRGDLCVQSSYGGGTEPVAQLVGRAEKAGLDFLAITDLNTMDSVFDSGFKSGKVALIPAMKWGNAERGMALVYAPRTLPPPPSTLEEAQAICLRTQAQGGVYAIAHPCFPTGPWYWGLGYVNGVQVWCRDWRAAPPLRFDDLPEALKVQEEGLSVFSIAAAAAMTKLAGCSANSQAERFYDYELVRGLNACAIGGSHSADPSVPLGQPTTWVRAETKSVRGILDGMLMGRTFVSRTPEGPIIRFTADVLSDGHVDANIGGVIPTGPKTRFEVSVFHANGKKVQVLLNGRPIITKKIEGETFVTRFEQAPATYSVYRVRVIGPAPSGQRGFGPIEVHALTSPIYAMNITRELVNRLLEKNPDLDRNLFILPVNVDRSPEITDLPENARPLIAPPSGR